MKKINTESEENLKELAKVLAINHLNSSIGIIGDETENTNKHNELKDILKKHVVTDIKYSSIKGRKNWKRVIMIIGAGATYNAFQNIPLGERAKKEIYKSFKFGKNLNFWDIVDGKYKSSKKELDSGYKFLKEKYDREYAKLKLYNKDRFSKEVPDFETSLVLLSHFFPVSCIRDKIFKLYEYRYGTTLYFDIISHLFKHRFVDIIVNFNFDELLDQAIKDELGKNYYHSILSDGDILPIQDYIIDKRLKKPVYIKPHGTYSHKSSLRFTKNHYDLMPADMKSFIEGIVTCAKDDGFATSSVLIVVGFAMESIEFDDILSKVENDTDIYYFEHKPTKTADIRKKLKSIGGDKIKFKVINISDIHSNDKDFSQLDGVFEVLWGEIVSNFKEKMHPPKIDRHKLIQFIFGRRDFYNSISDNKNDDAFKDVKPSHYLNKDYFENTDYFLDRSKIEILIETLKKQGEISIKYLLQTKAGEYFSRYYDKHIDKQQKENIKDWPISFIKLLENLQFKVFYLKDTCKLMDWEKTINNLNLSPRLDGFFEENEKEIEAFKNKLWESKHSILKTDFNDNKFMVFSQFKPDQLLHTRLAYEYEILKRLNKEWEYIVIIEDSHNILDKYRKHFNINKKIISISSTGGFFYESESVISFNVPPELHNHHLVLFVTKNSMESIYYYQNGHSNLITPIVIKEKLNLSLIIKIIESYFSHKILEKEHKYDPSSYFSETYFLNKKLEKKHEHDFKKEFIQYLKSVLDSII